LLVLPLVGAAAWAAWRQRHQRPESTSLGRVFRRRELRELDGHLERVAADEQRQLEIRALRYVAGDVGHVVVVQDSPHGIGLGLSDGHRLLLGGVSRYALTLLTQVAANERLRPAGVERDGLTYRLVFRGEAGTEMEIFARRVALAL
jgi:hypothetical protein